MIIQKSKVTARLLPRVFLLSISAIAATIVACAQAGSPPGGEPDKFAPLIVSTSPDTNAVVSGFSGPVVIRFDETLSERGTRLEDLVMVSPETGEVSVDRDGNELKIEIEGGWRSGLVYLITVLPGIQDRFGNQRAHTYQMVFSTGPEIPNTAIAGIVTDRLTRRPVANARLVAVSMADTTTRYSTLTDTAGFFALRALPLGTYRTYAFLDTDRNRTLSGLEPRDERPVGLTSARDTPIVELSVLALDTTAARLLRAEAEDSTAIRLGFDDFIAPTEQLRNFRVALFLMPDSTLVSGGTLHYPRDYEAQLRAKQDTAETAAPTPPPAAPGVPVPAPTDTVRLPTQELVYVPFQPLTPGARYRVTVFGVRNMVGLDAGGGSTIFDVPARAKPPADSTSAPADSTSQRR